LVERGTETIREAGSIAEGEIVFGKIRGDIGEE
jgi:hypothetical protein